MATSFHVSAGSQTCSSVRAAYILTTESSLQFLAIELPDCGLTRLKVCCVSQMMSLRCGL